MYSSKSTIRAALASTAIAVSICTPVLAQEKSGATTSSEPRSAASKGDASKSSTQGKSMDQMTVLTPVLVLLPTTVSADNAMKNGCWAKLYDQKNYQGDSFTLGGPIDLAKMTGPFGFNWENKVRSMQTGPKTSVTIYDNRDFKDQDKRIASGSKVPDMSKQMGFFDDFRSMKITCSK